MAALMDARTLTLDAARCAVAGALEMAASTGIPICVAVVDRAGHLLSFDRMDRAPLLSSQLAQDKGYTVAAFGLPTHEWWEMIRDEPPVLCGVVKTDRLIVFGGGVPITYREELVGAIGVSGGSADKDRAIAEAGARACAQLLQTQR